MNQKSCHTIVHCDWAKHCAIFQVPNATQHVYPTETGEFCHIYVPKELPVTKEEDEAFAMLAGSHE